MTGYRTAAAGSQTGFPSPRRSLGEAPGEVPEKYREAGKKPAPPDVEPRDRSWPDACGKGGVGDDNIGSRPLHRILRRSGAVAVSDRGSRPAAGPLELVEHRIGRRHVEALLGEPLVVEVGVVIAVAAVGQ